MRGERRGWRCAVSVRTVMIGAVKVRRWCRSDAEWVSGASLRSSGVAGNEVSRELGNVMGYIP